MATTNFVVTLDGKPAIGTPNSAVRDVQLAINNIRERLKKIEAAYNSLAAFEAASGTGSTTTSQDISGLLTDLAAIEARVTALEGEVPTDVYVNSVFVATRHALNFIAGGGLIIVGSDDALNNRVNILFEALVDLQIIVSRGALVVSGRQIDFTLGKQLSLNRGSILLSSRAVDFVLSSSTFLNVARAALVASGRSIGLLATGDVFMSVSRGMLRAIGRTIDIAAPIQFAVNRARLLEVGRSVDISLPINTSIDVTRALIALRARDYRITENNVVALLHLDGSNGSTTFTDEYASGAWTSSGSPTGAQLSTAQAKFGATSAAFVRSSNSQIASGGSSVYQIFGGDFCVDCWFYLTTSTNNNQCIFEFGTNDANRTNVSVVSNLIVMFSNGSTRINGGSFTTLNSWVHVALERVGTTITLYVNGTSVGTSTTSALASGNVSVSIGSTAAHSTPPATMDGYVDEVRICTSAKFRGNFTPRTGPYQPSP